MHMQPLCNERNVRYSLGVPLPAGNPAAYPAAAPRAGFPPGTFLGLRKSKLVSRRQRMGKKSNGKNFQWEKKITKKNLVIFWSGNLYFSETIKVEKMLGSIFELFTAKVFCQKKLPR